MAISLPLNSRVRHTEEVIRAVTLDAHGVLLLPDPNAIRTILGPFDCRPNDLRCWQSHYEMVAILDSMADPDWPKMNRSFAAALGVQPRHQDQAGNELASEIYLGTSWVPAPGAAAALLRLTGQGFAIAVVTNTVHGATKDMLERMNVCGGSAAPVEAIIDSHVIGIEKPDRRPFQMALDAMSVTAAESVHIGDSLHSDVAGALAVGMEAVHIDPLHLCLSGEHQHSDTLEAYVSRLLD